MNKFMLCAQSLLLCLCVSPVNAAFHWNWVYPPVQGKTLTGMDVMFPTSAIAVGVEGTVILTTDRGLSWHVRSAVPGQPNLNAVSAITSSTVIVVSNEGLILRSTDAGQTWQTIASGTTENLHAVDFHGLVDGFAVGTNGTILRSTDAGATWLAQTSGTSEALRGVRMVDAGTATVVGAGGTILKTTDGGATWTPQTSGTTADLFAVDFYGTNPGMAVGNGAVLITEDGGATWLPPVTPVPIPAPFNARGVDVTGFPHAVIVGTWPAGDDCPAMAYTSDAGTTWSMTSEYGTSGLFDVAMFTGSEGVAIGGAGTIRRTTNGGVSWPQVAGGVQHFRMQAVDFIDPLHGAAVARENMTPTSRLYRTTDGGVTWSIGPSVQHYQFHDVALADENTVYVVGRGPYWWDIGGTIWRNGVEIFTACCWPMCPECVHLRAVDFAGPDVGIAVGWGYGLVTILGGVATWGPLPASAYLNGVSVPTPQRAYAVGDSGTIFKGDPTVADSWVTLTSGTTEDLHDVCFIDEMTGWAVGENGIILHTSDGGDTWGPQTSGTTSLLTSVSFIDAANGIVGTDGPIMLKTPDGGNTWLPEDMFFPISDIDFVDPVCAVAAASSIEGIVMHRDAPVPVFFQKMSVSVEPYSVALRWEVYADEAIQGFRVHRREATVARTSDLLAPADRAYIDRDVVPGSTYEYSIVAIGENGNTIQSQPLRVSVPPASATLLQNTPNPFNPSTHIRFALPARAHVTLNIFDVAGRRVATLVDDVQPAGEHDVVWDGRNSAGDPSPSGIYFYELRTPGAVIARKMVLLK